MSVTNELVAQVKGAREECRRKTAGLSATESYSEWQLQRARAEQALRQQLNALGAVTGSSSGNTVIKLAGVRSTSTCGLAGALDNWLTAARKQLGEALS